MAAPLSLSSTKPLPYADAKTNALQLIRSFNLCAADRSAHYPHVGIKKLVDDLKNAINNQGLLLSQESSSLCGPASFFFALLKIRPDIYVQLVIDLFTDGKAKFMDLKLQSSASAKQHNPTRLKGLDWMLLSSIKPNYDNPSERFDGITFPGELMQWFTQTGFTQVEDNTNLVFTKDLKTLLKAQNDYNSGHTICLFVDAEVFTPLKYKEGGSFLPNHWVVMSSDIKIRTYDKKTKKLAAATIINKTIIDKINKKIYLNDNAVDFDDDVTAIEEINDRILLDAFTWGVQNVPVASRISTSQEAKLSYFLKGFYGYIKVKR